LNQALNQNNPKKRLFDARISGAICIIAGLGMFCGGFYDGGMRLLRVALLGLAFILLGIRIFFTDARFRIDPFDLRFSSSPLRPKLRVKMAWYGFAVLLSGWIVVLALHLDRGLYAVVAVLIGADFLAKALSARRVP
jgi:hypothetical protein